MKLIVLGGAGDVGSRAVEDLAATPGVTQVTIADRDVAKARSIAQRLAGAGGAKAEAQAVDAADHAGLVAAIRGHDVCASALGPFHRFEVPAAAAAIEAGVHYASVCDEWEPAEEVLDRFAETARRRGVVVLTGLGTSPGMTNVGARLLAKRFDRLRRVDVSVYQPLDAGGGPAVIKHMLHVMTGRLSAWRGGQRVQLPACSESQLTEFPRYGSIRVWNMGHSEPVTVPRFLPAVEEVNFFMGFGKGSQLFVTPARLGLFASPRRIDLATALVARLGHGNGEPAWGAVRVDAWGEKDGIPRHHLLCGVGQMREATGLCLSIGALMLARGELLVQGGGAFAPEAAIDPALFLAQLGAKGLQAYEDLALSRPIA